MKEKDLSVEEKRLYENINKEARSNLKHIGAGSYQTKARYKSAMDQFDMYLAKDWKKRSLKHVNYNHFHGFVEHMKAEGLSNSTIATTMSGVRYYFDQVTQGRIKVPSNRKLGVAPRTRKERINVNRAMPLQQFIELVSVAKAENKTEIELQIKLGFHFGLRIHEILGMKRYDLKNAAKAIKRFNIDTYASQPFIKVKGKTGKIREVVIETVDQFELIEEVLKFSSPGYKRVFKENDNTYDKMHHKIDRLQKFIAKHRNSKYGKYDVTAHSMRHAYAQNMDERLKQKGISEMERKYIITKNLGHERLEVVDIYLDNIEDWNN